MTSLPPRPTITSLFGVPFRTLGPLVPTFVAALPKQVGRLAPRAVGEPGRGQRIRVTASAPTKLRMSSQYTSNGGPAIGTLVHQDRWYSVQRGYRVSWWARGWHDSSMRWAVEAVPNPTVLRLHATEELTDRTILTCPPAVPLPPLERLLSLPEVRTLDLHRYRCRVNLRSGTNPIAVGDAAEAILLPTWGPPEPLPPEEGPRAFAIEGEGPRLVAESREMAGGDPVILALFDVQGVVEVVLGSGMALVRLGRLFRWADVQPALVRALRVARPPP
jgi:hypothetical protein